VITVAFIGYLVASLGGAVLAAVGIFLPVYVFTVIPAPWFKRNRDNAQLKAFVQGATAAATGAITGSVVVLAQRAVYDVPTGVMALIALGLLWRFKIPEPVIVLAAGILGILVWPLVRGGGA
jgi:chromate transporter